MKIKKIAILLVVGLIAVFFLDGCASKSGVVSTQVVGGQGQNQPLPKSEMERILAREFAQTHQHMANHADALAAHILQVDKNAAALAESLVLQINRANEKTGRQLDEVQVAQRDSLEKLELLSKWQGSGQITLFFKRGSALLDRFQYQRLITFLDYLSRESRGREIILVSIGSASATGREPVNRKLSMKRSEAPLIHIKHYLVNTPYKIYEVAGLGSRQSPKKAGAQTHRSYQSVRIIAVYDRSHLPQMTAAR